MDPTSLELISECHLPQRYAAAEGAADENYFNRKDRRDRSEQRVEAVRLPSPDG